MKADEENAFEPPEKRAKVEEKTKTEIGLTNKNTSKLTSLLINPKQVV